MYSIFINSKLVYIFKGSREGGSVIFRESNNIYIVFKNVKSLVFGSFESLKIKARISESLCVSVLESVSVSICVSL